MDVLEKNDNLNYNVEFETLSEDEEIASQMNSG